MYLDEKIVKKKEDSTVELKENGDGGDIDSNAVADDEVQKSRPRLQNEGHPSTTRKIGRRVKAKALEEKEIPPNEGKIVFYKNGQCQGIILSRCDRACTQRNQSCLVLSNSGVVHDAVADQRNGRECRLILAQILRFRLIREGWFAQVQGIIARFRSAETTAGKNRRKKLWLR